jgi:signal transduction histidine kinase
MTGLYERPAAFLFGVRWLGWLIALAGVLAGAGRAAHGVSLAALLAAQAVLLTAELALVTRPAFRAPISARARRILLGLAAFDGVTGLAVVYLSGGWGSPFYHYAVMTLLVPAFLLPLWKALAWAAVFTLGYVLIAITDGVPSLGTLELLGRRAGTIGTPTMVAFVTWYLARLNVAVSRERERAEQALSETGLLFGVAEAAIANLADMRRLVGSVVATVEGTQLFRGLHVRVYGAAGEVAAEDGFGDTDSPRTAELALAVRGEALGTLTLVPADGAALAGEAPGFMEALAQQVALGMYNARLFAQREELATQAERARIAREIHDGMAQSLYMLSLGLEACADAAEAREGELGRRLAALVGVSKQALWEARRYIFDLTPPDAGEHSLVAMLQNLTREFETVSRVPTILTVEGAARPVPSEDAAALYRIGQEALANVFKHADARHAVVTLAYLPDAVRLTVADDGRGLPVERRNGYGLGNMRRRAEDAGGALRIESVPGGGTTVCAEVPATEGGEG